MGLSGAAEGVVVFRLTKLFGYEGVWVATVKKGFVEASEVGTFCRFGGIQTVASEGKREGDGTFGVVRVSTGKMEILHVVGGFDVDGGLQGSIL